MAPPKRIGQIVRIKKDSILEYKACHAEVWPAVLKQIKDCNISDYSIFLDEKNLTLFAYMVYNGDDLDKDMEKMRANPEVQRWWKMTDAMQETMVPGTSGSNDPKGWWVDLPEVFHLD